MRLDATCRVQARTLKRSVRRIGFRKGLAAPRPRIDIDFQARMRIGLDGLYPKATARAAHGMADLSPGASQRLKERGHQANITQSREWLAIPILSGELEVSSSLLASPFATSTDKAQPQIAPV